MNILTESLTSLGLKRNKNEDRLFSLMQDDGSLLIAVADGMGGVTGGAEAASIATSAFKVNSRLELISREKLKGIALEAHQKILDYGLRNQGMSGMGTTLTAALIKEKLMYWTHIGDSRLYRFHCGHLKRLTTDHRFLESMIRDGDMTLEEAKQHPFRSILEQCLGCPDINFECGSTQLALGDFVLLCTDGLHDELEDAIIEKILTDEHTDVYAKATELMESALANGGRDNITLILVRLMPG